jgi:hypothetical protein
MKYYSLFVWGLNAVELISCVLAFLFYIQRKPAKWRLFPFYLLAVFLFEMTGRYLAAEPSLLYLNPLLFNFISFPAQFLFFFYLYSRDDFFRNNGIQLRVFILVYLVAVVTDAFFFRNKVYFFHSFSYSIGTILLLVVLIQYFYRLSTSDKILYFSRDSMFWFSLGLFIYYIGTMPYWAIRNVLVYQHRTLFINYSIVVLLLDILMYCLFIVSVIKWKRK